MSVKKRRFNDSYIEYGFTCIIKKEERPQCVICNKVLSNDSLKPTKLKQHLHNVHQQHKDKSRSFFERHASAFKKMRLYSNGTYHETNKNAIEASYYVALEIARQKKLHTIGENLIKPCSLKIVELMLGNVEKKKLLLSRYLIVQFREGSKIWLQTLEIKLCKRLSLLHLAYFQFSWTNLLM